MVTRRDKNVKIHSFESQIYYEERACFGFITLASSVLCNAKEALLFSTPKYRYSGFLWQTGIRSLQSPVLPGTSSAGPALYRGPAGSGGYIPAWHTARRQPAHKHAWDRAPGLPGRLSWRPRGSAGRHCNAARAALIVRARAALVLTDYPPLEDAPTSCRRPPTHPADAP